MPQQSEMIRQEMDETRGALADKLETLEKQVVHTVSDTTSAVTDTVEAVKETVQETVEAVKEKVVEGAEAVKETFNVSHHFQRRPWLCMAGSIAAGYLAGRLLQPASRAPARSKAAESVPASQAEAVSRQVGRRTEHDGWLASLSTQIGPQLDKLKSLAVGTTLGFARDLIGAALPTKIRSRFMQIVDETTQKLGGSVIEEPLVAEDSSTDKSASDEHAGEHHATQG